MEVDTIDWLIAKTSALIWRSLTDSTVFKADDSGYHLAGFENQPIKSPFQFGKCLLTSVEDLYRPRGFDELHRLRPVYPGISVDFIRRQPHVINIDRSRFRPDEIRIRRRVNRSDRHHWMQTSYHSRFGPTSDPTPTILAENGFEIVPVEEGCDGNFQLVHNLGMILVTFVRFSFYTLRK